MRQSRSSIQLSQRCLPRKKRGGVTRLRAGRGREEATGHGIEQGTDWLAWNSQAMLLQSANSLQERPLQIDAQILHCFVCLCFEMGEFVQEH